MSLGLSIVGKVRNAIGGLRIDARDHEEIAKYVMDVNVDCVPLSWIVEKHSISHIDVLHIDTEGHDYHVLRQLDFYRLKPSVIFFESFNLPEAELASCLALLHEAGYECSVGTENSLAVLRSRFAGRAAP